VKANPISTDDFEDPACDFDYSLSIKPYIYLQYILNRTPNHCGWDLGRLPVEITMDASASSDLPGSIPFVNESALCLFNFCIDSTVCAGMRHDNGLYKLVVEFQPEDKHQAYRHGYQLTERGIAVIISISARRCAVWSVILAL
jgi:hypothetical protein